MNETNTRNASDVLLHLEERVNTLLKMVAVYDTNLKIILDRVNKVYALLNEPLPELQHPAPAPMMFDSGHLEEQEVIQSPEQHQVMQVATEPQGQRRGARIPNNSTSSKKVPVSQRVTNHSGKDQFAAQVEIMTPDRKEIIHKTKTNAAGKWQAHLTAGNYVVHITKIDTISKQKLDTIYEITVPESNTPVVLPLVSIKKQ